MKPIFSQSSLSLFILSIFIFFIGEANAQRANSAKKNTTNSSSSFSKTSSLSIADVSVTEGNSGSSSATFTVKLLPASGQTVTVSYASANGTATAGSDYLSVSSSLTFNPGDTAKSFSVFIVTDLLNEFDETFYINLSNVTNATISDSQAIGTILNDDAVPTLTINDINPTETNSGSFNSPFTVTLSAASGKTVTVDYTTANGTATAGSDYSLSSGQLIFNPGVTAQNINVFIYGDATNEANETFFVNLSNAVNATFSDSQGVGTIANDDPVPNLSIGDVSVTEGNSGNITARFLVTLSAVSGQNVTVNYYTVANTAASGTDFSPNSGTLVFNAGSTLDSVLVFVKGDFTNEIDETFYVNINTPVNAAITDSQGVGTIINDDPVPTVSITDVSATEGNSGTKNFTFTAYLSLKSGRQISVQYATSNGTAIAETDYITSSGTLTFNVGDSTKTASIVVKGDTYHEANETFYVTLSNPNAAASLGDSLGIGTIQNDDPIPAMAITDVTVLESDAGTVNANFSVYLTNPRDQIITVDYATVNGTGIAGSDYVSQSGTLTFVVGDTVETVTVPVIGDIYDEIDENYFVNLSNISNATFGDNSGTGTIIDNDPLPTMSITDISVIEGNSGTVNATFNVYLSLHSGKTISVVCSTANATANFGVDYQFFDDTLTFSPGDTLKTVTVVVNGDLFNEGNETFVMNLSNVQNATLSDAQGIGTIINDDPVPTVSITDVIVNEADTGTVNANFTVRMTNPIDKSVTIQYTTTNGTATSGTDYISLSGTLTFEIGDTVKTLSVAVKGDLFDEIDEDFTLNLSGILNATFTDSVGICTIIDNDNFPNMTITDASVNEGNAGTVVMNFQAKLSIASGKTITASYATSDATATSQYDYVSTSSGLTFNPGDTSKTISVTVNGDKYYESNETFSVNLSNVVNATLADGQGVGTIINDDAFPSFTITDVSLTEGNSGTKNAVFTVQLSNPRYELINVNYTTANGSATSGSDYISASGTLTFNGGDTSKTITVTLNGDIYYELTETLFVNISNATNATISDAQGIGIIVNDDAFPNFTITDATVMEGNTGTVTATFTVKTLNPRYEMMYVDYATANGTAIANEDYVATNGTLLFSSGDTVKQISVDVNGDLLNEIDETFFVNLSNVNNATVSDSQALGTITNDDPLPSLSINNVTLVEGDNGTQNFVFDITLSSASGRTVTVNYATANGTASSGFDYATTSGTATFTAGDVLENVSVPVNGDLFNEIDETFFVNLTSPTNATIAINQGTGTIINNDPLPSITITDVSVSEGDASSVNAVFQVKLNIASGKTVSVNYATANGTAIAGSDYVSQSNSLTFNAGDTMKTITISTHGDFIDEFDETYFINLSSVSNATIADSQGLGTILDNDQVPNMTITDTTIVEGNSGTKSANFQIKLSLPSGKTITVDYATANGTATAGSDYVSKSGALTFTPGDTTKTVSVTTNGDNFNEEHETFFMNLSNASNAALTDAQGIGTILNDDAVPSFTITDTTVTETDAGTITANFLVRITNPSDKTITVQYGTANGTAIAGADYNSQTGTLIYASGDTLKTISITVNGDLYNEVNETFFILLSNVVNATISDSQGVCTILDNDPLPNMTISDATVVEGNSGTVNLNFQVKLSILSGKTITVNYATANGTAIFGTDYISTNGSLTFYSGDTTKTVSVVVNADRYYEENETLYVNISNAVNAIITDAQGIGIITNDDPVPSITINDVSLQEANGVNAVFTVRLSNPRYEPISVNYSTANGTALADYDYVSKNGLLVFNGGDTAKTVVVGIIGDEMYELNETFFVNLSNATLSIIADSFGVATIMNDDNVPTIAVTNMSVIEGNVGTVTNSFIVNLSNPTYLPVSVDYYSSDITATSGYDYYSTFGTLFFDPGQTSKDIPITVISDSIFEENETFAMYLLNASNATFSDTVGQGTIINDDIAPSITIGDVALLEGDSINSVAKFVVTLTGVNVLPSSVYYTTVNGTALSPSDYIAKADTLKFDAGEKIDTIFVTVKADLYNETNETFSVKLLTSSNVVISDSIGVATILNDDPFPFIIISDTTITETDNGSLNAEFFVSLTRISGQSVTVEYATANGTANAGSDYISQTGTITFVPGDSVETITVSVLGETMFETDENFFVNLSNPVRGTIGDGQGSCTILNNDVLPTISIDDVQSNEGDTITFTLTLSNPNYQTVTVNYATANLTAKADTDYYAKNGTASFSSGEVSKTISVLTIEDNVWESDDVFVMNLTSPTNATILDNQGIATITNDDPVPSITISDVNVLEGNSGVRDTTFAVTLSNPSSVTISVSYFTANGISNGAIAGVDYGASSGTLTYTAGQTVKYISVVIIGDDINEADETFTVNLFSPTNSVIQDNQALGTIVNDDPAPTMSISDVQIQEGNSGSQNATFIVTISEGSSQLISVKYSTINGTATAGTDFENTYATTPGVINFPPGTTTREAKIIVYGDNIYESNETFTVVLSDVTNAILVDTTGIGTITNDDAKPTIAINDVTSAEGDSGNVQFNFTVSLNVASGYQATANFITQDVSATNEVDYIPNAGIVTFASGETQKSIPVVVKGDKLNEQNETFKVLLSNATDASFSDSIGIGTITNDDPGFFVSPSEIEFDSVIAGSNSYDTLRITNDGASALQITSIIVIGGDYTVSPTGIATIAPAETKKYVVTFSPALEGEKEGSIIVTHSAYSSPDTIPLAGTCSGDTITFRTFTRVFGGITEKPTKLKWNRKTNSLKEPPNVGTAFARVFQLLGKGEHTFLGIQQTIKDSTKKYAWLNAKKAEHFQKLYSINHDNGIAYPIDFDKKNGKKLAKDISLSSATKEKYMLANGNIGWAEGVMLRMNILASDTGVTPRNFGSLMLDTSYTLFGKEMEGLTIYEVADYWDSLMTHYERYGIGGTNSTADYDILTDFSKKVLRRINAGFYAAWDSTTYTVNTDAVKNKVKPYDYLVTLKGTKSASEVGIVKRGKIVTPQYVTQQRTIEIPEHAMLEQNFPNPFNPSTVIPFVINFSSEVSLKIFNVLGQEVATLLNNDEYDEGEYEINFDASQLPTGIYFYRLSGNITDESVSNNSFMIVKKMLFVK
jgi:hypothetical protein